MGYLTVKYRVRVRTVVIGEIVVSGYGYNEEARVKRAVELAQFKSRHVQLRNARRPLIGGDFEVLTVEPVRGDSD